MSIYGMVSLGVPALGTLAMGALAEGMGLVLPVLIGSCLALAVGVTAWILRGRFGGQPESL